MTRDEFQNDSHVLTSLQTLSDKESYTSERALDEALSAPKNSFFLEATKPLAFDSSQDHEKVYRLSKITYWIPELATDISM